MSGKIIGKRQSIVYRVRICGLIFLLLFFLDFVFSQLSLQKELQERTRKDYQDALNNAVYQMKEEYSRIGENLYLRLSSSEAFSFLENGTDFNHIIINESAIVREMNLLITNENLVDLMMVYAPFGEKQSFLTVGTVDYTVKKQIENIIRQMVDEQADKRSLQSNMIVKVEENYYRLNFYRVNSSYAVIVTSLKTCLSNLHLETDDEKLVFLENKNGLVYMTSDLENKSNLISQENIRQKNKNYWVIHEELLEDELIVNLLIHKQIVYADLYHSWAIFLVWMGVLVVLFQIGMYFLNRFVTAPVVDIVNKLDQIGEDNWEEKIEVHTGFSEYQTLIASYNSMITNVKELKLENYEKQVATQKLQLQYLQLQVKPHFYLNALNIVYSMAQVEDYATIQKLTLSLIEYSRYMYRDATTLVRFEEEAAFVKNHIAIQQIRYMDEIEYREDFDATLMDVLIPPFVVETFVENSIKYGSVYRRKRIISVSSAVYKKGYMKVVIRDNGNGFEEGILKKINENIHLQDTSGEHIGIQNVQERLKIIFGNHAKLLVSNDNGAVVTLYIPYE